MNYKWNLILWFTGYNLMTKKKKMKKTGFLVEYPENDIDSKSVISY